MKKTIKFLGLFLVLVCLVVGCNKGNDKNNKVDEDNKEYLTEISFNELKEKLNNKEDIILEIVQTGCANCTVFSPRFESVLNEYKIQAYSLNTSYLDEEGKNWLAEYHVDGTPTVIFFEKGEETSTLKRLIGSQTKDKIISKLKSNGYIEK